MAAPETRSEGGLSRRSAHHRRDAEPDADSGIRKEHQAPLDPLCCQMAHGVAPDVAQAQASSVPSPALPLREDLQNLLSGIARRAAWGGDRRKGSARIELSEGAFAGATLIVHAEQRSVSVEIDLPQGSGAGQGLQQRILDRLEARGFAARVRIE